MEDASKSGEGAGGTKEAAESKEETAAAEKEPEASDPAQGQVSTSEASSDVDVDLAAMSSTLVFAEVKNIMYDPYSYVGKIIRMKGRRAALGTGQRFYRTFSILSIRWSLSI